MQLIKLNEGTAARRRVPVALVDDTDGKTAETGVTLSAGDMKVSKNGAAEGNHGGTLTELAGGDYYYEFSSGEVDTVGYLTGRIVKSGVRTFRIAAQVVAFDPYDAAGLGLSRVDAAISSRASQTSVDAVDDFVDTEIAAIKAKTDNLPADPADASDIAAAFAVTNGKIDAVDDYVDTEIAAIKAKTDQLTFTVANQVDSNPLSINGSASAAARLSASALGIVTGTAATGTLSTTQMTTSLTEATDDHYIGRVVVFTGGVLDGQATVITDYAGAGGLVTMDALTEAPLNGQSFVIL